MERVTDDELKSLTVAGDWGAVSSHLGRSAKTLKGPMPRSLSRPDTLVTLSKAHFVEDLLYSVSRSNTEIVYLSRKQLKGIAQEILPSTSDFQYAQTSVRFPELVLQLRKAYESILGGFLTDPEYRRFRNFISGNFVYWAEQEFAWAVRKLGGTFSVYHKEALLAEWPAVSEGFRRAVVAGCCPFGGTSIAFASEQMRDLALSTGVIDEARTRCVVVGSPRLDVCHATRIGRKWRPNSSTVTFFSFSDASGVNFPHDPERAVADLSWSTTGKMAAECVINTLERTGDGVQVVVQIKPAHQSSSFARHLNSLLKHDVSPQLRSRLSIGFGGDGGRLARTSSVCVALNSTVVFEAIAAGTPVIVPRFGPASLNSADRHLLRLGDAAIEVQSPDDLVQGVRRLVTFRRMPVSAPAIREEILDRALGNPDGQSGRRFQRWLRDSTQIGG